MPCKKVQRQDAYHEVIGKRRPPYSVCCLGLHQGFIFRLEESIPYHSLEMNHKLFHIFWERTGLSIIKPCVPRFHGFSCFEGKSAGKLSNWRNEEYAWPNPQNLHFFRGLRIQMTISSEDITAHHDLTVYECM